jgi:competence protein ComFC
MTIELVGNWMTGRAFDVHTLSSTYLGPNEAGHAQWENVRSEMGELVYKLKYRQDKSTLPAIVSLLDKIKGGINLIISFQSHQQINLGRSNRSPKSRSPSVNITESRCLPIFLAKTAGGKQLKNIDDPEEREKLLRESLSIEGKEALSGKKILLVDDLYRSGATLRVATELLLEKAKAEKVSVLTMTKTRSNR